MPVPVTTPTRALSGLKRSTCTPIAPVTVNRVAPLSTSIAATDASEHVARARTPAIGRRVTARCGLRAEDLGQQRGRCWPRRRPAAAWPTFGTAIAAIAATRAAPAGQIDRSQRAELRLPRDALIASFDVPAVAMSTTPSARPSASHWPSGDAPVVTTAAGASAPCGAQIWVTSGSAHMRNSRPSPRWCRRRSRRPPPRRRCPARPASVCATAPVTGSRHDVVPAAGSAVTMWPLGATPRKTAPAGSVMLRTTARSPDCAPRWCRRCACRAARCPARSRGPRR